MRARYIVSMKGIYAGTFDPVTVGHMDIICRASRICDGLVVAIAHSPSHKTPFLGYAERERLIKKAMLSAGVNAEVIPLQGLLVNVAREHGCGIIVRGLRAVSDFDYEQAMAHANRSLNNKIETVFLLTTPENSFISSSLVREVLKNGGDARQFLPRSIHKDIPLWS
jgi:pantetheine-phosphate adenylyltransferase